MTIKAKSDKLKLRTSVSQKTLLRKWKLLPQKKDVCKNYNKGLESSVSTDLLPSISKDKGLDSTGRRYRKEFHRTEYSNGK